MASNTRGVKRVKLRGPIQGPQTDPSGPASISFPGGEYPGGLMYPRAEVEPTDLTGQFALTNKMGEVDTPDTAINTSNFSEVVTTAEGPKPTGLTEKFSKSLDLTIEDLEESKRLQTIGASADMAAGVMKAVGGVINANSKYSQTINRNNFNLQMAEIQSLQIASDTRSKMLKEQTKGVARGQNAQLAAVAQGQAAGGDLATTAMSNEEVYAAENMMALEINSMRQIFGIETQKRMIESSSRMAEISRDMEVTQAISGGAMDVGMGALQLPGM